MKDPFDRFTDWLRRQTDKTVDDPPVHGWLIQYFFGLFGLFIMVTAEPEDPRFMIGMMCFGTYSIIRTIRVIEKERRDGA